MHRIDQVLGHLTVKVSIHAASIHTTSDSKEPPETSDSKEPPETLVRWNGWGFRDTAFALNAKGQVALEGDRYLFSGSAMPNLRAWMEEHAGLRIEDHSPSQSHPDAPPAIENKDFLHDVKEACKFYTTESRARVFHSRGHSMQEIYILRNGQFKRVVDMVVWPGSHEDVEVIVQAAVKHNVVLIPFGGGTTVTQSLMCPEGETRMIVSVDMHYMNRVKWINRRNMLACVEAGMVGKDLEESLRKYGLVVGHEPDSAEFSTLGGWVATRASGMRKNKYGNIEDIVIKIKMVTALGTVEKSVAAPRVSVGPDIHQFILGSEGTLGIITEVVVKVKSAPKVVRYGSIVFPDFESGVAAMHELATKQVQPVSIRLLDNLQFQFGQALKPEEGDWKVKLADKAKKWYVTQVKKFELDTMVAATLLFEGLSNSDVRAQERVVYNIAAKYGGMKAGEANGVRGYFLTYMIAYLRDFGLNYNFVAESFETSVPWDQVLVTCHDVKERIREDCESRGIMKSFISCRVTQTYETGACVYFYFGFIATNLQNVATVFSEIEHNARDEILKKGGSLSHHHGVGKLRKAWMAHSISPIGVKMLQGVKAVVDPKNIFANGNLINNDNDLAGHHAARPHPKATS